MGMQLHFHIQLLLPQTPLPSLSRLSFSPLNSIHTQCAPNKGEKFCGLRALKKLRKRDLCIVSSSSSPVWDGWAPENNSKAPSLSDIFWPSAGAFAAMAILGKIDQMLAPKGISMTIAPLGAVCAVLFATPSSPGARKYNMFMAQIGCAAIGVLAFSIFGPGWLARSTALAAALAFMIVTRAVHPPAASLPLLFIDGIKLHHLNFWYALFPGAAACIFLCLLQEMVCYFKENLKF
ncbi:Integral membrane HPP family protein [Abeliophyllum distichum]|uniref:Integral membrane HPP family protein n=1 Tax=Abeliophyllum distichum TaxID=126358 RepID=A0ABD1RWG0_9LAMI